MDTVQIPDSSVHLSRLGFGCARIFGGREMRASARLIETALKIGITHFDTAPSYGSESVLGDVLDGMTAVTIATKVGVPRSAADRSAMKRITGPLYRATLRPLLGRMPVLKSRLLRAKPFGVTAPAPPKRRLLRDSVMRDLEESLRSLRRTSIDLYLVHEPDAIELTDELRELFLELRQSGAIKSFGLAFGGAAAPTPFGSVVQCRYKANAPSIPDARIVRIHHGVVRCGMQTLHEPTGAPDAAKLVSEALASHPNTAVIFSASNQRQLAHIGGLCRE